MKLTWNGPYWFFSLGIAAFSLTVAIAATAISFEMVAPHLLHYAQNTKLPLYAHIVFAPLALALAPFQFWRGLRTKRPKVHRVLGYGYAISILIAGIGALLMVVDFEGTTLALAGFLVLDVLWIGSTAYAVNLARQRDFVRHPRWMMRSAALSFAAVTLRLFMPFLMALGMTIVETYNVTAWASWLIPLAFVEWRLRRRPAPIAPAANK